ncbi:MAG: radical SAM protein [Deltaproteobacteria bacterium]|nr:radical SAM protein [Deltaproteobacteria bacterium]
MTQLNTPYPATAYLTGFLRQHEARLGVEVIQADAAIELFLRLFSRAGLGRVRDQLARKPLVRGGQGSRSRRSEAVASFLAQADRYISTVDSVVRFLQGRDPGFALRIVGGDVLPEGPRFAAIGDGPGADDEDPLAWAFGGLGTADRAKHLASLYIDDLADAIREGIDPEFELARYGERLASSAASFEPLRTALEGKPTLVDDMLDELARELVATHRPDVVGLTAPFPGNIYGAFRIARAIKAIAPATRILLGGGYVNTELRELTEPRVFDYVDFITLDDGEAPILALLEHLRDAKRPLLRTFVRARGVVHLRTDAAIQDVALRDAGTPTYVGLALDRYLSLFEMLNPMHRLWSDGRWNKLTIAHGCYWKQCTFCDVTLDYIARYDRAPADLLVDRIEALIAETGQTGFHFVDEAAPPAALRALAETLIARNVMITWWGNVRFEKAFTPDLCALLARSGCVAISGGLEVASDRLLELMKKGVTVEQVARVTRAFTDAGIMVHAYLMYGFPTETAQDTVDALERVRQLFVEGCIQSAFWHRFAATAHSPIGKQPALFGIKLSRAPKVTFARNEVAFVDPTGCDHDAFAPGLRKALYNYMHGLGLDVDPRTWFAMKKVPKITVPPDLVRRALATLDNR